MRVRYPFAGEFACLLLLGYTDGLSGAFAALVIISAYVGLAPNQLPDVAEVNDKALHFVAFFLLTVSEASLLEIRRLNVRKLTLYWTFDLPRRILLKFILISALLLSVASEVVQGLLPNSRNFDPIDIAANVLGSIAALALCAWYHRRMLERRRRRKLQGYGIVGPGEGEEDLELGESGSSGQELGVVAEEDDEDDGEAWDNMDGDQPANANGNAEPNKDDAKDPAT